DLHGAANTLLLAGHRGGQGSALEGTVAVAAEQEQAAAIDAAGDEVEAAVAVEVADRLRVAEHAGRPSLKGAVAVTAKQSDFIAVAAVGHGEVGPDIAVEVAGHYHLDRRGCHGREQGRHRSALQALDAQPGRGRSPPGRLLFRARSAAARVPQGKRRGPPHFPSPFVNRSATSWKWSGRADRAPGRLRAGGGLAWRQNLPGRFSSLLLLAVFQQ